MHAALWQAGSELPDISWCEPSHARENVLWGSRIPVPVGCVTEGGNEIHML